MHEIAQSARNDFFYCISGVAFSNTYLGFVQYLNNWAAE